MQNQREFFDSTDVVFRLDCFQHKGKWMLNEVDIFPIATDFLDCYDQLLRDVIDAMSQNVTNFVLRHWNSWMA